MRNKPTTVYTPRVKPTSTYTVPRDWFCYTWDTIPWTWAEANFSWDDSCADQINSSYTRPRKVAILQTEQWLNFELENWELLLAEWGLTSNIIQTIYT